MAQQTKVAEAPAKGGKANGEYKKEKKEKKQRVQFVKSAAAASILDSNGRLKEAPGARLNHKEHKPPKKTDFAAEHVYLRYRADQLEESASDFMARSKKLRAEAESLEKSPNPAARQQVRRIQRLREQLASLEKQLSDEGISLSD